MTEKWMLRFCLLADHIAQWSKDTSTKVGCVLVQPETRVILSTGFNGLPRGVLESDFRTTRPIKYLFNEHAERNAVYNAARHGVPTLGCWAFLNINPDSICTDCARALIQAGVVRVYGLPRTAQADGHTGWRDNCTHAQAMLCEAGVGMEVVHE